MSHRIPSGSCILTGDVSATITESSSDLEKPNIGTHQIIETETVIGGQLVTFSELVNIVLINSLSKSNGGFSNFNTTIRIRRNDINGEILASGTLLGGSNELQLSFFDLNQDIGDTVYVLTSEASTGSGGGFDFDTFDGFNGAVVVCNIADTHACS